jgi:hypothetical protein
VRKRFYAGAEFVQNIVNINDALHSRHGIMVVGQPISGKTASIKTIVDVLNYLHHQEFSEKYEFFMRTKAKHKNIPIKMLKGEIVPKSGDPALEIILKITQEERLKIYNACKFKGVSNLNINPKSVTLNHLMGKFDDTSREWADGLMSYAIR